MTDGAHEHDPGTAATAAARRDATADDRDATADDRDATADDRDLVADRRDVVAERRDTRADARDRAADTAADTVGQRVTAAHLERRAAARDAAAADRDHASADRAAWARDRARAGLDRGRAGSDRVDARQDRDAAEGDRGTAARDLDLAGVDPLTGALLRGAGRAALARQVARAEREATPLAVAFVDVDGLKTVNDSAGHPAGDQLLRDVVTALRSVLRPADLVVRHGGDEFLCVFPGVDEADARARMTAVGAVLAALPRAASVTAGLAARRPGEGDEELVARADAALYRRRAQRRSGRDAGAPPA